MPFLAALLTLATSVQATVGAPGFHPDETLTPPGGPEIAVFRSVAPEVVSLRLSIPLEESPGEAGAGQFLQIRATERMETLAERIGARAEVHRTPQGIVYQVSGAVADFDFLGWILREGVQAPSSVEFDDARRRLEARLEQRMETPRGVLADRVRSALAPSTPSVYGHPGSLARLDPRRLQALWERSHHLANARLVVAGRVPTALVLALATDLGLPETAPTSTTPPPEATGAPQGDPELLRYWVVDAYRLAAGEEAAGLVASRWLARTVRESDADFELGVEIWDIGGRGRALVVTGVAYPRSLGAMQSALGSLVRDAASSLTEEDVGQVAGEIGAEIVMAGRTPWGLAEIVGQAWDAGSGPEGVETLVSELDALGRTDLVAFLDTLDGASPIREELRP